ncbi:E3 SUMO-protein ligase ZBED1-like [Prorops nasuta]|uniref:E3 SUMO-protein ligase ZBED1-like n=1 Tax=Prorops nasuta TaxID=863751 RepID=UPI0034CDA148
MWKYFVKSATGGKCKFCQHEVKGINTTNLKVHLERAHPNIVVKESSCGNITPAVLNLKRNKAMSENNDDCLSNPDDSDCYNSTASSSSSGIPVDSVQLLQTPVRKQPRIDMTLVKQNSFQDGGKKASETTNNLIFMICKDNLPFQTVEKQGFKRFVKALCPLYKIPCRSTITTLIEEKYEVLSEIIKLQLHTTEHLSLTTDIWTDPLNIKSFLGLTSHYICDNKLKSVALGVTELKERHTAEYIEMWLLNTVDEWKICIDSIVAIVSDNGANIKKAVKDAFGESKHLSCFAHSLNLIPTKVIESKEISFICKKVKCIVTYFKKSVAAMDNLRSISDLKLIQSIETRWNSTHDMFERFVELFDKVSSVLLKFPAAPIMVTAKELQILKEFIVLLKPFKEATNIISGESYLTASKVIPIVNTLKTALNDSRPTTETANEMKKLLLEQFELRFSNIEEEPIFGFATILDPRFKSIHFRDKTTISKITNEITAILHNSTSNKENEDNLLTHINISYDHFWSYHQTLVHQLKSKEKHTFKENKISEDLRYYLNYPPIEMDTCPIQYWSANNSGLNKLGRKYLAAIASSVPCERLFSKAGRIVTESRNRLNSEHLHQLLFLGSLPFEDWIFYRYSAKVKLLMGFLANRLIGSLSNNLLNITVQIIAIGYDTSFPLVYVFRVIYLKNTRML